MLECVINVSEGRDQGVLDALARTVGPSLLDVHSDPDHHRSVFTLAGDDDEVEDAARSLAAAVVGTVDLRAHSGVHPRIGALDVVPFVALEVRPWPGAPGGQGGDPGFRLTEGPIEAAVAARDRFAAWAGDALRLPCFCYGPERSLPDVRRGAWSKLAPSTGPNAPHPTAGACAPGARGLLVAYNLWLAPPVTGPSGVEAARAIAARIRGPGLRALGLAAGPSVQVSCNLIDPLRVGPAAAYDAVAGHARIARAELVGLLPLAVLESTPRRRWEQLGLAPDSTIEARLSEAGLDGGSFTSSRP